MAKPILQALLLADQVYQDKATNKFVIAGTFTEVHLRKLTASGEATKRPDDPKAAAEGLREIDPWQTYVMGSPFAYVSLTDVRGCVPLELRFVDLNDYRFLLGCRFEFQGADPLATNEIAIRLPNLPIAHPGAYALELLTNDEVLGSHRIIAQYRNYSQC